jgi:hypothetical protein
MDRVCEEKEELERRTVTVEEGEANYPRLRCLLLLL